MSRLRQAAMLWDLLVGQASRAELLTYSEAARQTGGLARGLGAVLQPIQRYCLDHNLPNLCVRVVRADTRRPGSGFKGNAEQELRRVRAYDWFKVDNPFLGRE